VTAQTVLARYSSNRVLRLSQGTGPFAKAARDRVVDIFGKKISELTGRTCRRYYLNRQEQGDVLSESYQQLFNPEITRFVASRGTPKHYFKGLVQNAARKIMAQLGKRRRNAEAYERPSCEPHQAPNARGRTGSGPVPVALRSPADEAELHDTAAFILAQATPHVRQALELRYWHEWPFSRIAAHLGISRFALRRQLDAFFESMNARLCAD
jgi:DNA-directed RNA polymerase specialized sigma24 family protein